MRTRRSYYATVHSHVIAETDGETGAVLITPAGRHEGLGSKDGRPDSSARVAKEATAPAEAHAAAVDARHLSDHTLNDGLVVNDKLAAHELRAAALVENLLVLERGGPVTTVGEGKLLLAKLGAARAPAGVSALLVGLVEWLILRSLLVVTICLNDADFGVPAPIAKSKAARAAYRELSE